MTKTTVSTPTGITYALISQRVVQQVQSAAPLAPYYMYIGHVFVGIVYAQTVSDAGQIARDVTMDDTARVEYAA